MAGEAGAASAALGGAAGRGAGAGDAYAQRAGAARAGVRHARCPGLAARGNEADSPALGDGVGVLGHGLDPVELGHAQAPHQERAQHASRRREDERRPERAVRRHCDVEPLARETAGHAREAAEAKDWALAVEHYDAALKSLPGLDTPALERSARRIRLSAAKAKLASSDLIAARAVVALLLQHFKQFG